MNLTSFVDFEAIKPALATANKRGLFQQLAQVAAQRLGLDAAEVAAAVAEREKLGCTGFGHGVAIPHGRIGGLRRVYCLVARLVEPLDYKAVDGVPVDLVFFLLSPEDAGAEHLKALAAVSRVARHAPTVEKMRGAKTRDALAAVLMGVDEPHAA